MMFLFDRHRRLRGQLSAYIDGVLDPDSARRLEAHLGECSRCRAELEQLRSTIAALQELPEAQVPRSFALSPERAAVPRPSTTATSLAFGARIAAAGVAAALAAILVVDLGGLGGDGTPQETAPTGVTTERQAEKGELGTGGAAIEGAPAPTAMTEEDGAEGGAASSDNTVVESPEPEAKVPNTPKLEGDNATVGVPPEPEGGAEVAPVAPPLSPNVTPAATEAVGEDAEGQLMREPGAAETPTTEQEEAETPAAAPSGGGIDALTAAEIGLAAALAILIVGSFALAFAGRRR
jgi:hypothetical protein